MSYNFARIFQQAERTFALSNAASYAANFQQLKNFVDRLVLSDLNVNLPHALDRPDKDEEIAPCSFISLFEGTAFSMSIFILNPNYTMPLHDHPNMCGMLKVISGRLKVQSYSRLSPNDEVLVQAENVKILTESSEASVLLPDVGNYHELTALDGRHAAFYDILSPPYSEEDERHCTFYRKIKVDDSGNNVIFRLIKTRTPSHYFCDTLNYEQPDFMR